MYSWLPTTPSLIIYIFLLLPSCVCQWLYLPSQCPGSMSNVWWKPLESGGKDPCELTQQLQQSGVHIGCCSTQNGVSSRIRIDDRKEGSCGPCNLQTYNIATACKACTVLPVANSSSVEIAITNNNLSTPSLPQWRAAGSDRQHQNITIQLPPWTSVPPIYDRFNVVAVVQNATQSGQDSSLPILQQTVSPSPSPASSRTVDQMISVPIVSFTSSPISVPSTTSLEHSSSSRTNAGAIAGGVLGVAILLALASLAVLLVRRRRELRVAPSAEFMSVFGPRAGYMVSQAHSPPPFTTGRWRDPMVENVPSLSTRHEFDFENKTR